MADGSRDVHEVERLDRRAGEANAHLGPEGHGERAAEDEALGQLQARWVEGEPCLSCGDDRLLQQQV